jgi:HAD superfamily hydrolase (TIGR01509 family)
MIDTIIFDYDGVIVDTEPLWDKGLRELLRRRGIAFNRGEIKHLISGRPFIETIKVIQKTYGLKEPINEIAKERIDILKDIFAKEKITFIPGFEEFYQAVKAKHKTCVVTSTVKELFNIVDKKLGLSKMFKGRVFFIADSKCNSKSELFLYCVKRLNSKKENALIIEDSPSAIEEAMKAGIRCVALTTSFEPEKLKGADLITDSFKGILKYLNSENNSL